MLMEGFFIRNFDFIIFQWNLDYFGPFEDIGTEG